MIAVFGDLEDDRVSNLNLEEIDKNIDYNGSHANIKPLDVEAFLKIDFKNIKKV